MKAELILKHEFVEYVPRELNDKTIYISIAFATVVHKCCCGCGIQVVTPLSPAEWKLIFDGRSVSLDPSIGNWSFPCKSHYWIRNNKVIWEARWSEDKIDAVRKNDTAATQRLFATTEKEPADGSEMASETTPKSDVKNSYWKKFTKLFGRK